METIIQINEVRALLEANAIASHNLQQLVNARAIFGFHKGSLTIHYNDAGRIMKIENHAIVYPS